MATENSIGSEKPIQVAFGGTGAANLTDHGVLVGSDAAVVTPLAVGTDGQILVGSAGADPVFATLTSAGGSIDFTAGAGTLNLEAASAILGIKETGDVAYEFVLGDAGDLVAFTSDEAVTVTIPPNSSVAFPVGSTILFSSYGEGIVTVEPGPSVDLDSRGDAYYSAGQFAMMSLTKVDADSWVMAGDIGGGGGGADSFVSQWNLFRPLSYSLNSVTYGDGRFIAVSSASPSQPLVMTYIISDENWYGVTPSTYSNANDVAYGDDGYWVIGRSGGPTTGSLFVATDPDGTWTRRPIGKGASVVEQGNGYWVIAYEGSYGLASSASYYTDDPLYGTLNGCSLGGGYDIRELLYANGYWVAAVQGHGGAGTPGWAVYTADPTGAWISSSYLGQNMSGVAYGGGYWVMVGKGCVYTATNPTGTWTANATAGRATGSSSSMLKSVTYADGYFIAVGNHGLAIKANNPTGKWTQLSIPEATTFNSITYGDNKVVSVGDSGKIIMSDA